MKRKDVRDKIQRVGFDFLQVKELSVSGTEDTSCALCEDFHLVSYKNPSKSMTLITNIDWLSSLQSGFLMTFPRGETRTKINLRRTLSFRWFRLPYFKQEAKYIAQEALGQAERRPVRDGGGGGVSRSAMLTPRCKHDRWSADATGSHPETLSTYWPVISHE